MEKNPEKCEVECMENAILLNKMIYNFKAKI